MFLEHTFRLRRDCAPTGGGSLNAFAIVVRRGRYFPAVIDRTLIFVLLWVGGHEIPPFQDTKCGRTAYRVNTSLHIQSGHPGIDHVKAKCIGEAVVTDPPLQFKPPGTRSGHPVHDQRFRLK